MGITNLSLQRLNKYLKPNSNILILGCQNLYNVENYGEVAHSYFVNKGHSVRTIDILGCQGSEIADLRDNLKLNPEFDLVLQHGTIEHIDGDLYQPFKNTHEALKPNGIVIHENPKTGNWPEHGYHYFTEKFYKEFAKLAGYELLEVSSEPAMGNDVDGWNVCAVLRKSSDKFISKPEFNKVSKHIKEV